MNVLKIAAMVKLVGVPGSGDGVARLRIAPDGVEPALLVDALVRVRPEEVPLRLHEVRRKALPAVRVEVPEAGGHAWDPDAARDGQRDHAPPALLGGHQGARKLVVQQQVLQGAVPVVGLLDRVQEGGPDDAPALPDASHLPQVDAPLLLLALRPDDVHALGVGADLGRVQRRPDVRLELLGVHARGRAGLPEALGRVEPGGLHPLGLDPRQEAPVEGRRHGGGRH
mmetsp:Transcript_8435/g.23794  ORF Transcript_8435/g.23794 Transcript_8435/m.23794 type:complete len:226 (-) Transcript_8435:446-1123(-)